MSAYCYCLTLGYQLKYHHIMIETLLFLQLKKEITHHEEVEAELYK
jgi:hypothetical protein